MKRFWVSNKFDNVGFSVNRVFIGFYQRNCSCSFLKKNVKLDKGKTLSNVECAVKEYPLNDVTQIWGHSPPSPPLQQSTDGPWTMKSFVSTSPADVQCNMFVGQDCPVKDHGTSLALDRLRWISSCIVLYCNCLSIIV